MKYIVLFLTMGLLNSCGKALILNSEKLHLPKEDYTGSNLRTDGYYYQFIDNSYFRPIIFYRNGAVLFPGGSKSTLTEMDNYILNSFVKKQGYKNVIYWWGIFNIKEDYIVFEKWNASEPPYKTNTSEGKVINDTTFIITGEYWFIDGVKTDIPVYGTHEYHFRRFSPKPDSTNTFMHNFLR